MCEPCSLGTVIALGNLAIGGAKIYNDWGKHNKPKTVVIHKHYHSPQPNSYTKAERIRQKKYRTPSNYHRPKYTPSYRDFENSIK